MKTITLTNDFHNTEATVRPVKITEGRFAGNYKVSQRAAKTAWSKLCGIKGCTCCDAFGSRGGNLLIVENQDYQNNYIVSIGQ